MAYEGIVTKGTDERLRSVYCSNTDGNDLKVFRTVAWKHGSSSADTGDGQGFGFAVDYAIATNSVVVGILWNPSSSITEYKHGHAGFAMARGVCPTASCWATCVAKYLGVPKDSKDGLLSDEIGAGTSALYNPGICGMFLATVSGTSTTTTSFYVSTLV